VGDEIDKRVETGVEASLEERGLVDTEGDGLYDRYLLALGLLICVIIVFAFTSDGDLGRLVTVAVEGVTLLVILRSSRVHQRVLVVLGVIVALAVAFCAVAILLDDNLGKRAPLLVGGLLAVVGPPVIMRRLLSHHRIDLTTVAGALCVYLLAGLFFSYVFWFLGEVDPPFFAQSIVPTGLDYVYFSFVTLATLGYGDLTPISDLGRMLAVTEAIAGQLYLVSAVALLVGNLGRTRTEAAPPGANRPVRRSRRQES
jgi:hypothetical protein